MPKKPEGYSSVSSYLVVDGARRVIDFLKQAFDATGLRRYEWPAFLEAGGVSVQEPQRKEGDPDRRGAVKDPAGPTWWIATQAESS